MHTMAISHFKSHALSVLKEVAHSKESIIITKRGKPLATVSPFVSSDSQNVPGKLSDALIAESDIVSPLENEWDACK